MEDVKNKYMMGAFGEDCFISEMYMTENEYLIVRKILEEFLDKAKKSDVIYYGEINIWKGEYNDMDK